MRPLWTTGIFASGFSASSALYYPPDTLEVTGLRRLAVQVVAHSPIKTQVDFFDLVRRAVLERLLNELYITGEVLLDAYAKTLSLGLLKERYPKYGTAASLHQFKELLVAEAESAREIKVQIRKNTSMTVQWYAM